jgi:glycosyltransferase involved in cell wall biosynthesis
MREADVVTTVARNLHQQAVDLRPDALYLPNGVEYERFAADDPASPDDSDWKRLLDQRKPIAGYYGALARWFDYRMLEAAAVQRQDWNFVLIGQSLDDSLDEQTLLRQPNVFWLGPRQYESLPGYLRDFDVALIPFVINRITQATSPLKLYEYLAAGKPVIATAMPECESVPDVRIAHDSTELARALDAARSQGCDDQFKERVRNFASQHSWSSRAAQVTQSIGVILRLGAERANLTDRNDLNAKPPATDPAGHESTQAAAKLKT